MSRPKTPSILARKEPKQERSSQLVAAVLEGAIRVLQKEGARRFTMSRIAERAGVSVGSLYQYFPNKEAILFQLQRQEWKTTTDMLEKILAPSKVPPLVRLRQAIHAFFQSECDEAELRVALEDAAPLYRAAPEAQVHRKNARKFVESFIAELLPAASAPVGRRFQLSAGSGRCWRRRIEQVTCGNTSNPNLRSWTARRSL